MPLGLAGLGARVQKLQYKEIITPRYQCSFSVIQKQRLAKVLTVAWANLEVLLVKKNKNRPYIANTITTVKQGYSGSVMFLGSLFHPENLGWLAECRSIVQEILPQSAENYSLGETAHFSRTKCQTQEQSNAGVVQTKWWMFSRGQIWIENRTEEPGQKVVWREQIHMLVPLMNNSQKSPIIGRLWVRIQMMPQMMCSGVHVSETGFINQCHASVSSRVRESSQYFTEWLGEIQGWLYSAWVSYSEYLHRIVSKFFAFCVQLERAGLCLGSLWEAGRLQRSGCEPLGCATAAQWRRTGT